MDLLELTMMGQKEVERMFAAVSYQYPAYSLQTCGWLNPAIILEEPVRKFWTQLKARAGGMLDDDAADIEASRAAVEAGIQSDLNRWVRMIPGKAMPQAFAGEIGRRAYLVEMSNLTRDAAQAIGAGDDLKARELAQKMAGLMPAGSIALPSSNEVAEKFEQEIDADRMAVETFIPSLDYATGGMENATLIVLAARPGMGKTALAWQIARNVATSGRTVHFFSLEMGATALWARAACPEVGVMWRDVLAKRITAGERDGLKAASRRLRDLYGGRLLIPDGRQTTETIWRAAATYKPDLVVVDHLRFVKDPSGDNENKRIGRISEVLHDLAKAFSIPVLLLAQLNREVEAQGDKRPQLKDLRDSGEIEENADAVWMLYRDEYYQPKGGVGPGLAELWVRKFRNGAPNIRVDLAFNPAREWFEPAKVG